MRCCHTTNSPRLSAIAAWVVRYEGVISKALKDGEGTKSLNVTLIDQGVNGGTVTDLVAGFSPWCVRAIKLKYQLVQAIAYRLDDGYSSGTQREVFSELAFGARTFVCACLHACVQGAS